MKFQKPVLPCAPYWLNESKSLSDHSALTTLESIEDNIQVTARPNGQVWGKITVCAFQCSAHERVEFEVVFFVGVDKLADLQLNLFCYIVICGTNSSCNLSRYYMRQRIVK